MARHTRWMVKFRGSFYAEGPHEFKEPIDERKFRHMLRKSLKVMRLPLGTEVWPAGEPMAPKVDPRDWGGW